jgi:hypothetical protein
MYMITVCNNCRNSTMYDSVDGKGFCMYCGGALHDKDSLTVAGFLDAEIRCELKYDDFKDEPWYDSYSAVVSDLFSGRYSMALTRAEDLLKDKSEEQAKEITLSIVSDLTRLSLESIRGSGNRYELGTAEFLHAMPNTDWKQTTNLIEGMVYNAFLSNTYSDDEGLIELVYHLLMELMVSAPNLRALAPGVNTAYNSITPFIDPESMGPGDDEMIDPRMYAVIYLNYKLLTETFDDALEEPLPESVESDQSHGRIRDLVLEMDELVRADDKDGIADCMDQYLSILLRA